MDELLCPVREKEKPDGEYSPLAMGTRERERERERAA